MTTNTEVIETTLNVEEKVFGLAMDASFGDFIKASGASLDEFVTLEEVMKQKPNTSTINVVVRFRPLLGDEINRQDKEIKRNHQILKSKKMVLNCQAEKIIKDFRGKEKHTVLFKGSGFSSILETQDNNKSTYNKTIAPLIPNVMNGNTSSCFCYGQTGSGKTHTTLGYGEEKGMYYQAADQITQYLAEVRKIEGLETASLSVSFAEMHLKKFYDLLDNRSECFVRETVDGTIHFRGNGLSTLEQETLHKQKYNSSNNNNKNKEYDLMDKKYVIERLKGKTLQYTCCTNVDEVEKTVSRGMKYRQVGTSTVHTQSSRSHAFIEMEIVTDELLKARQNIIDLEAEVDYYKVVNTSYVAGKKARTNLKKAKKYLTQLSKDLKKLHPCISGMLVFIDLAGAENGKDIGFSSNIQKRTFEAQQEGKEINMSLMSLNEVMRKLQKNGSKITWRGSYLTQAMKRYLEAKNSVSTIMCNVASSTVHEKKTKSTLYYASQMIPKTNNIHKINKKIK